MGETLRAFFAIDLPESIRGVARRVRSEIEIANPRAELRWVADANLHLTLKFLGDIEPREVPKLLARAASRVVRQEPFEATLSGLGAFPSLRTSKVLWLGIGQGSGEFAKLARKLEAAARGIGAQRERQPFRAHLTLARSRKPQRFDIASLPEVDSQSFSVDRVVLYESRLSSSGSTYVPLAQLPLGAEDSHFEFAPEL